jgi:serine protease Do
MPTSIQPRLFLVAAMACLLALGGCVTASPPPVVRSHVGDTSATFSTALARGVPAAAGVYGVRQAPDPEDDDREAVSRADGEHSDSTAASGRKINVQMGAGFIVSADGLIATAAHIVAGATQIIVKLADRRVVVAELVGIDGDADIAVIRVPVRRPPPPFGTSASLRPGDWVLAVGEPYGLDRSVAAGVVGGRSRHFAEDGELMFIQSDLALNPGNSGGPLLDVQGRIVGMNLRTVVGAPGGPGLSLSVPIELVLQIVAEITGQAGTSRPRLGAGFEDVTPFMAVARGRPYANGALINEVRPGGLAASMGVRKGDIVVGMNGRPIGDSADFADALLRWRAGETTRLTVFREGHYRHLTTDP